MGGVSPPPSHLPKKPDSWVNGRSETEPAAAVAQETESEAAVASAEETEAAAASEAETEAAAASEAETEAAAASASQKYTAAQTITYRERQLCMIERGKTKLRRRASLQTQKCS